MEWSDDELSPFNQNQTETNLVVFSKTYRRGVIQPHGIRSKYICDPRRVVEAGNHYIWEFLYNTDQSAIVSTDAALLHHYRYCNNTPTFCDYNQTCTESIVVDRTIYKYKNELIKRIKNTRNSIDKKCFSP